MADPSSVIKRSRLLEETLQAAVKAADPMINWKDRRNFLYV